MTISGFINAMGTTEMNAMGVPTAVQLELNDFRTSINEFIDFYEGTSTTQTEVIGDIVEAFRHMS